MVAYIYLYIATSDCLELTFSGGPKLAKGASFGCQNWSGRTEGSATIPNHVDDSRNHLESLLESENQMEILESRIIISTWMYFPYTMSMNHVMHEPLFGKQVSQESIQESRNQTKSLKITE